MFAYCSRRGIIDLWCFNDDVKTDKQADTVFVPMNKLSSLIANELHKIIFKSTTFLIQFLNDELSKAEGFLRHQSEYMNISRRAVLILTVNHSKSR